MTEIRNLDGEVIASGDGTVAEVARANKANLGGANLRGANLRWADLGGANLGGANLGWANLRWANLRWANLGGANLGGADLSGADLTGANLNSADLRYIPAPLVLLAQWGELPDYLTIDLMRYDAANHPEPERFLVWASGGLCPYSGTLIARAADFRERRELIKADFLSLHVKSAWGLVCELANFKGFRFAEEVK